MPSYFLAVNDTAAERRLLANLIRDGNCAHELIAVTNTSKALDEIRNHGDKIKIVLADYNQSTSTENGLQFLKKVKEALPEAKLILTEGILRTEHYDAAIAAGIHIICMRNDLKQMLTQENIIS